jgi:hypothetical protein
MRSMRLVQVVASMRHPEFSASLSITSGGSRLLSTRSAGLQQSAAATWP